MLNAIFTAVVLSLTYLFFCAAGMSSSFSLPQFLRQFLLPHAKSCPLFRIYNFNSSLNPGPAQQRPTNSQFRETCYSPSLAIPRIKRRSVLLLYLPPSLHSNRLFIASITFAHSGRKQCITDWRNKITEEKSRRFPSLCGKHFYQLYKPWNGLSEIMNQF